MRLHPGDHFVSRLAKGSQALHRCESKILRLNSVISRFTYEHRILLIGSDLTASTLRPYNTLYYLRVILRTYTLIRVSREPDNRWRGSQISASN